MSITLGIRTVLPLELGGMNYLLAPAYWSIWGQIFFAWLLICLISGIQLSFVTYVCILLWYLLIYVSAEVFYFVLFQLQFLWSLSKYLFSCPIVADKTHSYQHDIWSSITSHIYNTSLSVLTHLTLKALYNLFNIDLPVLAHFTSMILFNIQLVSLAFS